MSRTLRLLPIVVIALAVTILRSPAQAAPPAAPRAGGDLDADQVRQAIEKGVAFLQRSLHDRDGILADYGPYTGATTSLCLLALLNSGVPADDPQIQKSLNYIRTLKPEKVYAAALQTMVFCLAEPKKDLLLIERNAKWLEDNQLKEGQRKGGWSYPGVGNGNNSGDNSNSQFALLALYEAERAGVPIQDETWRLALAYWKSGQNPEGSWSYYNTGGTREFSGTGSMTCAGITSLVIAAGRTSAGDAQADGPTVHCCGNHDADNSADKLELALKWLGRPDVFTVQQNPRGGAVTPWHYYYLYGLERVGRMTARRFIGEHDWYREGAAFLLSPGIQQLGGQWQGTERGPESDPNIATSFALLFLSKGRRPILMAKLKHGPADDWNRHRNDAANLTDYVESRWKKEFPAGLSWQVVDLSTASVEDLLQSPVLFINGSQVPEIDERQGQMLRDYIDRGGFLFAEACCADSQGFDRGFRALMRRIFPPEYQLKPLPLEHPIWRAEEIVPADQQRTLLGIEYGCRTSVVYCPPPQAGDPPNGLSCYWELAGSRDRRLHPVVEAQIAAANSIGLNVLAYATNRELKAKEDVFNQTHTTAMADDFARGKLYIANLRHSGGCDTAPAALPNLLRSAERELKIRIDTGEHMIDLTDPALKKYTILFMHGRRAFHFSAAEREALRAFIHNGGTLLADSICSNREFTASFRREMQATFGGDPAVNGKDQPLAPIPAKSPLFSRELGGYDLSTVEFRQPQAAGDAGRITTSSRRIEPELEGIKLGDRYGVIFSKFDLSCALENHGSLECEGYSRDDAERLGLNVLLYSLHQ